jgi:hypothetical protein
MAAIKASAATAAPVRAAIPGKPGMLADADVVDEVARLTLDSRGSIIDCNGAGESLFKIRRNALVKRHVSELLPQLAQLELLKNDQINPHLRFLIRIGRTFQAVNQDGEHFVSEIFLNVLGSAGSGQLSLIVRPIETSSESQHLALGD